MKTIKILIVLTGLFYFAGCASTKQSNFNLPQAKQPEKIAIYLDNTVSDLKESEKVVVGGVSENDLYNSIKANILECFGKGYVEVLEVPSAPPYKPESFSKAGLDYILVVGLSDNKFIPPILLAIEGYKGRVTLNYKLYNSDGILSMSGTALGKAHDTCLVMRFSGKKIFSKVFKKIPKY